MDVSLSAQVRSSLQTVVLFRIQGLEFHRGSWIVVQEPEYCSGTWIPGTWIPGTWDLNSRNLDFGTWIPRTWILFRYLNSRNLNFGTWIPGSWILDLNSRNLNFENWIPGTWGTWIPETWILFGDLNSGKEIQNPEWSKTRGYDPRIPRIPSTLERDSNSYRSQKDHRLQPLHHACIANVGVTQARKTDDKWILVISNRLFRSSVNCPEPGATFLHTGPIKGLCSMGMADPENSWWSLVINRPSIHLELSGIGAVCISDYAPGGIRWGRMQRRPPPPRDVRSKKRLL